MRVLVASDLSQAADVALREGIEMASASKGVLAVVRALPILTRESMFFPVRDAMLAARAKEIVVSATVATHEHVARFAPAGTEIFVDEGIDYEAIVRRAKSWHADVVVVGSHGHSRLARVLGDVACKVARLADCSVLVARPSTKRGCVVAATDLSDPSLEGVIAGVAEANRRHARLSVVHARSFTEVELAYLLQIMPSVPLPSSDRELAPNAVSALFPKVKKGASWVALDGPAAAAIVSHAENIGAELVVVGTHGATGLARIALGGVAEKVIRGAACSVLVARSVESGDRHD